MRYAIGVPPSSLPPEAQRFLQDELRKIQGVLLQFVAGEREVLHAEPARVREGMVVYADGSDWDPGLGEGLYGYNAAGDWKHVGRTPNFTVATLPPAADHEGAVLYVTDANATTRHSVVAGGGTDKLLVYSNATNWLIV